MKDILQGTQAGTWELDLRNQEYEINDFWAGMLGYTIEELKPLTTQTRRSLLHPDDEHQALSLLDRHVLGELEHYSCEVRMKHKLGHWVWVLDRGQVSRRNKEDKPIAVSGTSIDITKSKQREQDFQLAASVFRSAREGITIADASGEILEVNEAFSRITGYSREEAVGSNPRILSSGRHDALFYAQMWQRLLEEDAWEGEVWNRRKNGEIYPQMLSISTVRDAQGAISHFVAVFSDISRQKEHENELEHIAFHDNLTGLPNRALLTDRLKQTMTRARRSGDQVVLAYIDLDGFKEINDTYGHDAGDRVLKSIAARLTSVLREEDTVARLGGDEFVVVLSERTSAESLETLINRLIARIAEPIDLIPGKSEEVSGSIGIVVHDSQRTVEPDQLIRQADQAMYQAKQAGKNRYHIFDADQEQAIRDHHENLERIRAALEQGEFTLYYQPKVNMRAGTVVGVEALIRWRDPKRGILPPASFLPHIQNSYLSIEIGRWVIAQALSQCAAWRQAGLQLPVSVNIDAVHLQQRDFVETLQVELSRHPNLVPGDLELEILETSAFDDVNNVTKTMKACQEIGVGFALDDFGTGYSSLTYLRRLPAHLLKLDRTFVRDMLEDPEDLMILEAVIGLAKAFRRDVIAEGIETIEHGRVLLGMGCQLGQGFAIAHPMPPDELLSWLSRWQPAPDWLRCSPLDDAGLPVIHAIVEQRACANTLIRYLSGALAEPPKLECSKCRFGLWLKRALITPDPLLEEVAELHRDYQYLGKHLIAAKAEGELDNTRDYTRQIESVRDRLVRLLERRIGMGSEA